MMLFSRRILSRKIDSKFIIVVLILITGLALTLILGERFENPFNSESAKGQISSDNGLGVTYLNITPSIAAYYDLEVDSGVLVTAVTPNSMADRVGLKSGDVIVSYNAIQLDENVPLYGMMRSCRPGSKVVLEIWRGDSGIVYEFVHMEQ